MDGRRRWQREKYAGENFFSLPAAADEGFDR